MEQIEDLIRADELSEESILRTLKARYAKDIIYVRTVKSIKEAKFQPRRTWARF